MLGIRNALLQSLRTAQKHRVRSIQTSLSPASIYEILWITADKKPCVFSYAEIDDDEKVDFRYYQN